MRGLVALLLVAGCGQVEDPPPDDIPRDVLEGLRGGCVLALHMDEAAWSGAAGEVLDDCGGDNPGKIVGGVSAMPGAGVRGGAGNFLGNGCIDIPDAAQLHASAGLTLSAWIKPASLKNGDTADGVISKRTSTDMQAEYSLSVWTGKHVWAAFDGDAERFSGSAVLSTDSWFQITSVFDGTLAAEQRAKIYVNGVLDAAAKETSATLTAYTSVLHVGCMPAPTAAGMPQQNFAGLIDEVVIWNRALSESELKGWYEHSKP